MNSTLPSCRARVRFPVQGEISYEPVRSTSTERWPARTLDISASGVALVTPRLFEPGSVLNVELPAPQGRSPRTVLACVIRVDEFGANEWVLGCRFAIELRDEDLQVFGARRQPTTPPDDRSWVRFPCEVAARCQSITEDEGETWPARVSRLTSSGADLVAPRSFEPGSVLSVELTDEAGKFSRTLLACVVCASSPSENECLVGCTFASELAPDELEALH